MFCLLAEVGWGESGQPIAGRQITSGFILTIVCTTVHLNQRKGHYRNSSQGMALPRRVYEEITLMFFKVSLSAHRDLSRVAYVTGGAVKKRSTTSQVF